jgi:thiol-disulfide isomerase/thioredoxin
MKTGYTLDHMERNVSNQQRRFQGSLATKSMLMAMALLAILSASPNGDSPVDLSLKDVNGKRVRLREYRGKIVVLNFWATWCGPCREEMPMLVAAEREYRDRGIVFIGASLDERDTQAQVPAFLAKYAIGFPVWMGATGDDMARLQMGEMAPATAFVDENGHIVARILGEMRPGEIKERLNWLMNGQKGPAPERLVQHLGKN